MKQLTVTTIVLLIAIRALTQSDSVAIAKVLAVQQQCWNNGDISGFMDGYWQSDSLVFVGSKGLQRGWQQTKDNYIRSYPDKAAMGKLSFGILELSVLSDGIARVVGTWHLARDKGDTGGYFTLIWRKFGDKWMIVSDHSN